MKKAFYLIIVILVLIGGIFIGIYINKNVSNKNMNLLSEEKEITIPVVGVNDKNQGILGKLTTTIRPGTGLVLVNINNLLAGYDTQYSARTAAHVAANYTKISLDNIDIIYSIKTEAQIVAGTSAGSAFAASTIALLENKRINESIAITGAINEDSTISEIGAVAEKAAVAKKSGMKLFLIPKGNLGGIVEKEKSCIKEGKMEYCELQYAEKLNKSEYGIPIEEISNIKDAMEYFYNEKTQ